MGGARCAVGFQGCPPLGAVQARRVMPRPLGVLVIILKSCRMFARLLERGEGWPIRSLDVPAASNPSLHC